MEELKINDILWLKDLPLDVELEDFTPSEEDFLENERSFKVLSEEEVAVKALSIPNAGKIAIQAAKDAQRPDVLAVREATGNNDGVYVETYQKCVNIPKGSPWCEAFAVFRLLKAAVSLKLQLPASFPRSGYTVTVSNWFKKQGMWISVQSAMKNHKSVQVGDHVFFYFATKERIAHTGIVVGVTKDGVYTVEGNTGPDKGNEVERDGQGVYRKFRSWAMLGTYGGFGRCNF